jgi:hypothetical protein
LLKLEEEWGGTIAQRMQARADRWTPSEPAEQPAEKPKPAKTSVNPRQPPTKVPPTT